MKVLLDECLPRKLADALVGHQVMTVPQAGWASKKNGELLGLAQADYDVFVTMDAKLPTQQKLATFDIAVVVLRAPSNRLADLISLVPELLKAIDAVPKGSAVVVGS